MARFIAGGRQTIPKVADIPDLVGLERARLSDAEAAQWQTGERAAQLRQKCVEVERTRTRYRYP